MQYGYAVILNGEDGDFLGHVTAPDGTVVYEVNGFDLVGQKFNGLASDLDNLKAMLIETRVINEEDDLVAIPDFEQKASLDRTDSNDTFSPSTF